MSWAPLTCCSIEAATDCATTSALAPGKLVDTVTCGGTTCGYWAIGRATAAKAPTRIISSAMTVEKTGRSMKKLNTNRSWTNQSAGPANGIGGANTSGLLLGHRRWTGCTGLAGDVCRDRL